MYNSQRLTCRDAKPVLPVIFAPWHGAEKRAVIGAGIKTAIGAGGDGFNGKRRKMPQV